MAKKVNKRHVRSGNTQILPKKEKNDKTENQKSIPEIEIGFRKSFIFKTFSFFDRMRPFPIAVLG